MNNTRYPYPYIPVTGKVLDGTTGPVLFGDLVNLAGTVSTGLYDADTYAIATNTGAGKVFFVGYSSTHTKDALDKFTFSLTDGLGAGLKFKGADVMSFEYSKPTKQRSEIWNIGYTGAVGCNEPNPVFECGKVYGLKIYAKGSPIFERWAKTLTKEYFSDPICCPNGDCSATCPDYKIDAERIYSDLATKINTDFESQMIGLKARVKSNQYSALSFNVTKYQLQVCDEGTGAALGAVKAQIATAGEVDRVNRSGSISTYEVYSPSALADFVPSTSVSLATCGVCPAGYTTIAGKESFVVTSPLAGTENLAASAGQIAYAAEAVVYATTTFNGATAVEVVAASDAITLTNHGFATGTQVTYNNGGGTSIVGLTNATNYFVIKVDDNTIKLATTAPNAVAGTAIAIADGVGAAHTLTVVGVTSTFISQNGSVAIVELVFPAGVSITAKLSDTVIKSKSEGTVCVPTAATPIAWVSVGTAYRGTRTLCISLNRKDCNRYGAASDRLQELKDIYANNSSVVPGSVVAGTVGVGCRDSYQLQQYSKGWSTDGCLAKDTLIFDEFGGFEGQAWEVVPAAIAPYDADKRVGIEISAELTPKFFSDCAMDLGDYYEVEPIRLEVTWIMDSYTGVPDVCDNKLLPRAVRTQTGRVANQVGEQVLREYIKSGVYENFAWDHASPRDREVMDSNRRGQIERKADYRYYYLQVTEYRESSNFHQKGEVFEITFVVKEGDSVKQNQLEKAILAPLSKFGVVLKERK